MTESIEDPLPVEFILKEPHWVLFEIEDLSLQKLLVEASPEVDELYMAIKKTGFSGLNPNANDENWQKVALKRLDRNPKQFNFVKRKYLEDKDLYAFAPGQESRDFKGRLFEKIVEEKGLQKKGARALFDIYRQISEK